MCIEWKDIASSWVEVTLCRTAGHLFMIVKNPHPYYESNAGIISGIKLKRLKLWSNTKMQSERTESQGSSFACNHTMGLQNDDKKIVLTKQSTS